MANTQQQPVRKSRRSCFYNDYCQFLMLWIVLSMATLFVAGQQTDAPKNSELNSIVNRPPSEILDGLQQIIGQLAELKRDVDELKTRRASGTDGQTTVPLALSGESRPRDCSDVIAAGVNTSGVYTVFAGRTDNYLHPVPVYCDMETDGGGWTVFQRRQDGSENFYRDWNFYVTGFGDLHREFWLGNDNLYALTRTRQYKLRVDLGDFRGNRRYAEYSNFKVGSDCDKFKLVSVGTYSGNAGDSLSRGVGQKFSTHDQDNDASDSACAVLYKGAWWYDNCHESNLNGYYYRGGPHSSYADGINWRHWTDYHYSLRFTEMKIKPNNA